MAWSLPTFNHKVHAQIVKTTVLSAVEWPGVTDRDPAFWVAFSSAVHQAIDKCKFQLKKEVEADQQQQLKAALQRICNDFGRRRHTFRKALMRDGLSAPLWGVQSAHPSQLFLPHWTCSMALACLPGRLHSLLTLSDGDPSQEATRGVIITCTSHHLLAELIELLPPGTASVIIPPKATLVADPCNKVCWIEHFFGMNAVGVLPQCSHHQHVAT